MIEIPDGERTPIWIEHTRILAVREHASNPNKTHIWLAGDADSDGWLVDCPVMRVLATIPANQAGVK